MDQVQVKDSVFDLLIELHKKRYVAGPDEVILELKEIRKIRGCIPTFPISDPDSLVTYEIFQALSDHAILHEDEINELASMLDWKEYAMEQNHYNILLALSKKPTWRIRHQLRRYLKYVDGKLDAVLVGKNLYASFSRGKVLAEKILAECA